MVVKLDEAARTKLGELLIADFKTKANAELSKLPKTASDDDTIRVNVAVSVAVNASELIAARRPNDPSFPPRMEF